MSSRPNSIVPSRRSLIKRPATLEVSRTYKEAKYGDSSDTETISISRFCTEPASVFMKYGVTVNTGNWESARVDVGVTLPCYKEEFEDTMQYAEKILKARIREEVKGINRKTRSKSERATKRPEDDYYG